MVNPTLQSAAPLVSSASDKEYPIQKIWILKVMVRFIPLLIIIFVFTVLPRFLADSKKELSDESGSNAYPIAFLAAFLFSMINAVIRRATFHFSFDAQFLTLKQGFLSRQERHIPYGVIQNLFVKQSLFDRIAGLSSLEIENAAMGGGSDPFAGAGPMRSFRLGDRGTARRNVDTIGFSGNKVSIPGLTKVHAETLKALLLQKMSENKIDDSQSGL